MKKETLEQLLNQRRIKSIKCPVCETEMTLNTSEVLDDNIINHYYTCNNCDCIYLKRFELNILMKERFVINGKIPENWRKK